MADYHQQKDNSSNANDGDDGSQMRRRGRNEQQEPPLVLLESGVEDNNGDEEEQQQEGDAIDYENLDLSFDDCCPSEVDVDDIIGPPLPPPAAAAASSGSFNEEDLVAIGGVSSATATTRSSSGGAGASSTFAAVAATAEPSSSDAAAAAAGGSSSLWEDDDDDLGKSKLGKQNADNNNNNNNCFDNDGIIIEDIDNDEQYILGTLIVRVVAARNLDPVETSGIAGKLFGGGMGGSFGSSSGGSSNPYASVRFGNATQRTSQVFGTVDPIWPRGEAMFMDVTHPNFAACATADNAADAAATNVVGGGDQRDSSGGNPGDPPTKLTKKKSGGPQGDADDNDDDTAFQEPVLTVAIFHASNDAASSMYPVKKNKGGGGSYSGDSDDVFLGMASTTLTELLTGKARAFDEWIPLSGCGGGAGASAGRSTPSGSPRRLLYRTNSDNIPSVRVVCEYEASDPPPRTGDEVQFTKFCHPSDLYPAHPNQIFSVEEDCNRTNDLVLISHTSPEGWVTTYQVHRYMLFTIKRHHDVMDMYQEEMVSISQRLANSPVVDVVQETLSALPEEGLVTVGLSALQGGASLLTRWLEGGVGTAVEDVQYATNWDGRFNPNAASQLSTHEENDENNSSSSHQGQQEAPSSAKVPAAIDPFAPTANIEHHELLPNMPACPITQEPMRDPVVAADGHTYERSAILRWLQTSDKSPLTGSVLPHKDLVANYMLLSSLRETAASASKEAAASTSASSSTVKLAPPSSVSSSGAVVVETVTDESDVDDEDLDEHTTEIKID